MRCRRAFLTVLISVWTAWYAFNVAEAAPNRSFKEGELLVQFKAGIRASSRIGLERSARVSHSRAIGRSSIHHIVLEQGTSVDQALAVYADSPDVVIAEPNYLVHAQASPGDAYFDRQWGLDNGGQVIEGYTGTPGADLDAILAWSISTGSAEVVVAVVDTGCDLKHPDLEPNIWTNPEEIPGNGIDDDGNNHIDDVHGWDFSDQDNDPQDASGHGSHVAGIIGAVGDNARGTTGVAWRVRIMPLRFMNAFDEGSTADAIEAIEYALDQGVRIINCSWGSPSYSTSLKYVMANADALFVCAAGNNTRNTDMAPFYPASFDEDNILSVAASDQMDHLAWFSNFGPVSVDVAAPGIRIFSLKDGRQALWSEDFDAGFPAGWTSGGNGGAWAVAGPPAMANAPALSNSPAGDYGNNADTWVQAPAQDLSMASASQLSFRLIGQSEAFADYLYLEVSTDGSTWYSRPLQMGSTVKYGGISGNVPAWVTVRADLGLWDGQPQLFLRLRFKSNSAQTGTGFYVDDLLLSGAGEEDAYQFMQGTSMAAGYVSGLAALILSENHGLSAPELKTIIESSTDLNQNLLEQVSSGGRVNAYNALTLLREISLRADPAATDRIQLTWSTQALLNSQILIERRTEGQPDFEIVAQVNAGAAAYTDSALASNATYYYRVQAQTQDGRSGYSNQTLATTMGPAGAGTAGSTGGSGGGCFVTASIN